MSGNDLLIAWTRARSALAACLAMTVLIVAATGRLAPLSPQHAPQGTTVDKSTATEHGIRPGQAGLRLAPDTRQSRPALGGGAPAVFLSPAPLLAWARHSQTDAAWAYASPAEGIDRLAHRPRGPPVRTSAIDHPARHAGMALLVSWNHAPVSRQGVRRS